MGRNWARGGVHWCGVGGRGGAVSVFGDFGLVVGGGGGGGAIGAWWIHCSIHLQMCSSKTGSVPRTLSSVPRTLSLL